MGKGEAVSRKPNIGYFRPFDQYFYSNNVKWTLLGMVSYKGQERTI